MAHSELLTTWIKEQVDFLAPVLVYPGESEMEALQRPFVFLTRRNSNASMFEAETTLS